MMNLIKRGNTEIQRRGFDIKKIHVKHCVKHPSRKDSVSMKNEKSELFDDEDGHLEEAKVTDGSD